MRRVLTKRDYEAAANQAEALGRERYLGVIELRERTVRELIESSGAENVPNAWVIWNQYPNSLSPWEEFIVVFYASGWTGKPRPLLQGYCPFFKVRTAETEDSIRS